MRSACERLRRGVGVLAQNFSRKVKIGIGRGRQALLQAGGELNHRLILMFINLCFHQWSRAAACVIILRFHGAACLFSRALSDWPCTEPFFCLAQLLELFFQGIERALNALATVTHHLDGDFAGCFHPG